MTRSGFRTVGARQPHLRPRRQASGEPGVRVPAAPRRRASSTSPRPRTSRCSSTWSPSSPPRCVRPAAAEADDACAAPEELLEASLEIGLPILGVPESLGGIAEERSAMAGTLVAEALAQGDMGLAVAALAPGSVATAIAPVGHRRAAADLPPGVHRRRRAGRRARAHRADGRSSTRSRRRPPRPRDGRRLRPQRREVAGRRAAPRPSCSSSAPSSTASPVLFLVESGTDGPRGRGRPGDGRARRRR